MKLRSGMPETEAALSRQGRYRTVRDNLRVKEVRVGDGDAAERFVVCHNPAEAERDRARREQRIARIEAELARLDDPARARQDQGRARGAPARRVRAARPPDAVALPAPDQDRPARARPRQDRRRGAPRRQVPAHHLRPRLSAEDVALGYKHLLEAERSFRDLKGTLALRPVFHRKDDRIRAHVLICFLALVLIRVAETRTGQTWRTIRAELGQIRQGHFRSRDGDFTQTTELTAAQRDLHAALDDPRATPLRPHHPRLTTPQPVGTRRTSCTKSAIPLPIRDRGLPAQPTSCGTPVALGDQFVGDDVEHRARREAEPRSEQRVRDLKRGERGERGERGGRLDRTGERR